MFHNIGLAAAQTEMLYQKIKKNLSGFPQHHTNIEHDLILYFHSLFKMRETEVLIYRCVDGDSQKYSYKNMLQTYAANLHEGPCWGVPS